MNESRPAHESAPPNEAFHTQRLAERLQAKIVRDNAGGPMRRDAHAKMHGLVRAEFSIEPGLPEALRVGLFSQVRTYPAWVRFSNQSGSLAPDIEGDIRGMAIKLMGVDGDILQTASPADRTADFILISTPVFVTRDVEEFDGLLGALTGSLWAKAVFFLSHWRVVFNVLGSLKKFANPLQVRYFSATPYRLGAQAVKYSARPLGGAADALPAHPEADFLRQAMLRQLAAGDALFDFSVQLQTDARTEPIEDPGRLWPESISAFQKVASIRIPRQAFDSPAQRTLGENLSFNPWRTLAEHRPLGGINRARRSVYEAISRFRHDKNQTVRAEPSGWDL